MNKEAVEAEARPAAEKQNYLGDTRGTFTVWDINTDLLHAERDAKRLIELSKNIRNFIRKQETQDGNIKRIGGKHYPLLRKVAEIHGDVLVRFPASPELKAAIQANAKHKPHMLTGLSLNQVIGGKRVYQALEEWIKEIQEIMKSSRHRRLAHNQDLNMERRKRKMARAVASAIDVSGRVLLVRVDLFYLGGGIPRRDIRVDLERFRRNINRNNLLKKGLVTGVVKLECGLAKGPHAHLMLLYDGNVRWRDERIGELVGRYWRDVITDGQGGYFNSNRMSSKESMAKRTGVPIESLAVGMLKHSDTGKLCNLKVLLNYLAKDEQRMCAPEGQTLRSLRIFSGPMSGSAKRGG